MLDGATVVETLMIRVVAVFSISLAMVVTTFAPLAAQEGTGKITKGARETIEATRDYTVQQKEAFQRAVQDEMASLQQRIQTLREKANKASSKTRAKLQGSINELEGKKEAARKKLDELKTSTGAKWSSVRAGMNAALEELKTSYQKALSHLP